MSTHLISQNCLESLILSNANDYSASQTSHNNYYENDVSSKRTDSCNKLKNLNESIGKIKALSEGKQLYLKCLQYKYSFVQKS